MATLADLQAQLRQLESEENRLRAQYESFTTRIEAIFAQERPLEVELRRQRGIIQDPNASAEQKNAALNRALDIEQQLRVLENQTRQLRDQQSAFLQNQLQPVQRQISGPGGLRDQIRQAETNQRSQAGQGPGTVSTGTTVSQGQQANAERADSQSPAPSAQTVTAAGTVTNTPASTNPSNAAASQTPIPVAPPAPNALPPGQVGAASDPAATVPAARGSQSPGAALQSGLVNLQSAPIDNTLVSYVYRAIQVTSSFRQGRFTQEIEGAQVFFRLPKKPQPGRSATGATGATPAVPQDTVLQAAATPGTFNLGVNFAGSEFGAFFGTGETGEQSQLVDGALPGSAPGGLRPPGSPPAQRVLSSNTFEAEGFGDPTAVQGTAQAPLQSRSPTSGTTNIAPRSRGNRGNTPEPTKVAPQQGAREY